MKIIDPGHLFKLDILDVEPKNQPLDGFTQTLHFVKRCVPAYKYPGNGNAYPGTNIQEVLRALISRLQYLKGQSLDHKDNLSVIEDEQVIRMLRFAIYTLEARAARRHGRNFLIGVTDIDAIETIPTCPLCGHIKCEQSCAKIIKL